MLPKKLKLPIEEFPKRSTLCFGGKLITLRSTTNNLGHSRFGVSVSKRINPKATVRNWVKRVMYTEIGSRFEDILPGKDLLVVITSPIIETSSKVRLALIEELSGGLKQLK